MIDYTIIIAHKNSPELLQYCLDSIPVREDVQVIVVDDDSSAEIVDFEHFPRWKGAHYQFFFTKEGKGAGYARNVGLEHAEGKWVFFLDADDYLLPEVNGIFDEEKETDADIIYFRTKAVMLEDRSSYSKRADFYNRLVDQYLESSDERVIRSLWLSAANKIIKLKLLQDHGIRFDEIRYSNDCFFSVKAGVCAEKIAVREKMYYCITESGSSLTSNFKKKPGELQMRADAFFRSQLYLYDHGYSIDEKSSFSFLRDLFSRDRKAFVLNFNRMRKMGYKKVQLLREVFKNNGRLAFCKRFLYAYLMTGK